MFFLDVKIASNSRKLGQGVLQQIDLRKESRRKEKEEERRKEKRKEEKKKEKQKEKRLKEKRKDKERRKEEQRKKKKKPLNKYQQNKQFNTQQQQRKKKQDRKQQQQKQQDQQQQQTIQPTWPVYHWRVNDKENRTQSYQSGYGMTTTRSLPESDMPYFEEDVAYDDGSRQKRVQIASPYSDNFDDYHDLYSSHVYEDESKIVVSSICFILHDWYYH